MFWPSFLGAFAGALIGALAASRLYSRLKNDQDTPIIKAMAAPRRPSRGEKRTPKANTDLIAYQKEIQDEGARRG